MWKCWFSFLTFLGNGQRFFRDCQKSGNTIADPRQSTPKTLMYCSLEMLLFLPLSLSLSEYCQIWKQNVAQRAAAESGSSVLKVSMPIYCWSTENNFDNFSLYGLCGFFWKTAEVCSQEGHKSEGTRWEMISMENEWKTKGKGGRTAIKLCSLSNALIYCSLVS